MSIKYAPLITSTFTKQMSLLKLSKNINVTAKIWQHIFDTYYKGIWIGRGVYEAHI